MVKIVRWTLEDETQGGPGGFFSYHYPAFLTLLNILSGCKHFLIYICNIIISLFFMFIYFLRNHEDLRKNEN